MSERFLNDRIELHCGDCRDVLATLAENSLDACVTDPPYGIGFMGKIWDTPGSFVERKPDRSIRFDKVGGNHNPVDAADAVRTRRVEGQKFQLWSEAWAREVYRVLKPGAHLIAMGGTRTYHRLACAIEDAGFEIRDTVSWLYGSGFPKSHDVSKGIDRAAGAEREIIGEGIAFGRGSMRNKSRVEIGYRPTELNPNGGAATITAPATDAAREWEGWGTALKPAMELIVLARKPLGEGPVAANVLRHGVGALNIDGCRVGIDANDPNHRPGINEDSGTDAAGHIYGFDHLLRRRGSLGTGRWPANVVHDGSDEVVAAFPETTTGKGGGSSMGFHGDVPRGKADADAERGFGDSGSAARFFYTAKANQDDRLGSRHPTVKPLDLMQWLVRLVTPPRGTCLDCFAGTGTLGEAAWREGMSAVLIEREPEYQEDIRRRMALVLAGPDERQRESIKARNLPRDDGPLFAPQQAQSTQPESWAEMWAKPFDCSQEPKA